MSNDIKERMKQALGFAIHPGLTPVQWHDLTLDALAEIEGLERLLEPRTAVAVQMMAAVLAGSGWVAGRIYNFTEMADDAVAATEALLKRLGE